VDVVDIFRFNEYMRIITFKGFLFLSVSLLLLIYYWCKFFDTFKDWIEAQYLVHITRVLFSLGGGPSWIRKIILSVMPATQNFVWTPRKLQVRFHPKCTDIIGTNSSCAFCAHHRHFPIQWFCYSYGPLIIWCSKFVRKTLIFNEKIDWLLNYLLI
jgi:hypothetical protein